MSGGKGLGALADDVVLLIRSSFKSLLPLLILYWIASVGMSHALFQAPTQANPSLLFSALCIAVMFLVCSLSVAVFSVLSQVKRANQVKWSMVWRDYTGGMMRFILFYALSFLLFSMIAMGLTSLQAYVPESVVFLVLIAYVLAFFGRAVLAIPALAQGDTLRQAICRSWLLSRRRMTYVLMSLLILVMLMVFTTFIWTLLQTACLSVVYPHESVTELAKRPGVAVLAGSTVFFSIPLVHAYLIQLLDELEARAV